MKRKINARLMMVAVLAILISTILTTIVYYQVFQKEVFEDLKGFCVVLEGTDIFSSEDTSLMQKYAEKTSNLRITLVDSSGQVIYDTNTDIESFDNHKNRPEIADAFREGEGKSVRRSSTINTSNYYYAIRLSNGNVLRVAKETRNIIHIFISILPVIILIIVLLVFLSMLVSHYLTKSFVKPIEQMAENLDHLERVDAYKELVPFIDLIREQHEDILNNAKMRQEFTANVSHELKTPLTSISGYSELIENGMVGEKDITRFAGEIHRNAGRLISLINDIIELSELDGNAESKLLLEDVDLYDIAVTTIQMLSPVAQKRNIHFRLEGGTYVIKGNKDMLEEVAYNLCDNAIRYNSDGGNIWITIDAKKHTMSVRDDGIGISEENKQRVFERFFRVDKSRSKKTGGTGLGLAIVKHIVELHNAKIALESAEGEGTRVTITF